MRYLTAKELIVINALIQNVQGSGAYIREPDSLDNIIESARQEVFGELLYPDINSVAAFYFINIVKKHVFNDSNKRTAVLTFYRFLKINHVQYSGDKKIRRELDDRAIELAATDGLPDKLHAQIQQLIEKIILNSD